jgi:hypothetical protein
MARNGLLGVSDPRGTRAYLEAMRSCVTDIAEIAGDEADAVRPPATAGPGEAALAGSDVLAACGHTLDAIDLLLLGIAEARRLSIRPFGRAEETFAAGRDMVRLLLADRNAIDASSGELLRATVGYLSHPPAAPSSGGGEDSARHPAGPGAPASPQPEGD